MIRRTFACLAVLSLAACASLDMPPGPVLDPGATLQVVQGRGAKEVPANWTLAPGSPAQQELAAWLVAHRNDWQKLLETPPPFDLLVRGPGVSLQFNPGSVIAYMPTGLATQRLAPGELQALFASRPAQAAIH